MDVSQIDSSRVPTPTEKLQKIQQENQDQVDHLRNQYEQAYIRQKTHLENALETTSAQNYERLRDHARTLKHELNRTRMEGESQKASLQDNYRNAIQQADQDGRKALNETQSVFQHQLNYENKLAREEMSAIQEAHDRQKLILRESTDAELSKFTEESQAKKEQIRLTTEQQIQESQKRFEDDYQKLTQKQNQILEGLKTRTDSKIQELRSKAAQTIALYQTQQQDPFYRLIQLNPVLTDEGDAFLLTVQIPAHEQKQVSVNIQENKLTLSGKRSSEQSQTNPNGHEQKTASFQSYHEVIPLPWPVDPKKITHQTKEDQMTFKIPKKFP